MNTSSLFNRDAALLDHYDWSVESGEVIRDCIACPMIAGVRAHAEREYARYILMNAGDSVLSEREERDIARAEGLASALELIHAELVA